MLKKEKTYLLKIDGDTYRAFRRKCLLNDETIRSVLTAMMEKYVEERPWGAFERFTLNERSTVKILTGLKTTFEEFHGLRYTNDAIKAAVELSADRNNISADRCDVAHFTARIVDARGIPVPLAENEVIFEIAGPGKLIGVDNGDMRSHEDYRSDRRQAFHGLCLAIVQATAEPGRIRLIASSPGLASGSVTIETV